MTADAHKRQLDHARRLATASVRRNANTIAQSLPAAIVERLAKRESEIAIARNQLHIATEECKRELDTCFTEMVMNQVVPVQV